MSLAFAGALPMPSELERLALLAAARQEKNKQEASAKTEAMPELAQVVGREDGVLLVNRGGSIRPATNYSRAGLGVGDVLPQGEGLGLEAISPEPFEPEFPIVPMVVNQRRVSQPGIIPFVYGVPYTFEYAYAPGSAPQELESASQWLYTRDQQRVPINHVYFIEIRYEGAAEQAVEPYELPEPVCSTFVTSWYQHYAASAAAVRRAEGESPSYFYTQFTVTDCSPPLDYTPSRGNYLHNASFIEHRLKIGPFDTYLTYTESISHSNGSGNRSSASFQVSTADPDIGAITQEFYVIHPDTLLDFEDQSLEISNEGRNRRAGNSMPYAWTLSSSVDSISGNGIKEVGTAWPVVEALAVPDGRPLEELTQSEIDEFLGTGVTPVVVKDVLTAGGAAYTSTNSVQIPVQRANGTPYISSTNQVEFVAGNQTQAVLPALGGITPLPANHDFYNQYLDLPYRQQGLADWLDFAKAGFDSRGNMKDHPLVMPRSLFNKLKARGWAESQSIGVAHAFCHLTGSPPTLIIPMGSQDYLHQVWAQNTDNPENIFWELRDPETGDNAAELEWRYPMRANPASFGDVCHEDFYLNRFANISNGKAYEVAQADLASIFTNTGTEAVSVPFTGKPIVVEDGACVISPAANYSKSFSKIEPTEGVTPLAAAPNKVGGTT
jgi:hypothetical protein